MRHEKSPKAGRWTGLLFGMLIFGTLLLSGCNGSANGTPNSDLGDYSSYLGEYSYNSSISAMVYEDMDGEGFGIQYRVVTDFEKLVGDSPLPVCLYFYSSLHTDTSGVTALVEQMAEEYHEKILFVSIDGMQEKDMVSNFSIGALPDFVLLKDGSWIASFSSGDKETWTGTEFTEWVLANSGIS